MLRHDLKVNVLVLKTEIINCVYGLYIIKKM